MTISNNSINHDNIVFHIDQENPKSWLGSPTSNWATYHEPRIDSTYTYNSYTSSGSWLLHHPDALNVFNAAGTDISVMTNVGVVDWTNTYHAIWTFDHSLKKPVVTMRDFDGQWKSKTINLAAYMGAWSTLGVSAGDKYTISWLQWTDNLNKTADVGVFSKDISGTNGFHDSRSYASVKNTKEGTWERLSYTYTVNAIRDLTNSYGYIYMYGYVNAPSGGTLKISDVQLEFKSYASKFTSNYKNIPEVRPASACLYDLANNKFISVSNCKFISPDKIYFNGVDSSINIGIPNVSISPNIWSIEFITKPVSSASARNDILGCIANGADNFITYYNNTQSIQFTITESADVNNRSFNTPASSVPLNSWSHVIVTVNNLSIRIYVNGVLLISSDEIIPIAPWNSYWVIGQRSQGTFFYNGYIDVFKIYNNILDDNNVLRNFNLYKSRYGI